MFALLQSLPMFFDDFFKPRCRLEVENLFLRIQLSIALRHAPPHLRLRGAASLDDPALAMRPFVTRRAAAAASAPMSGPISRQFARDEIDRVLGAGVAARHPELWPRSV